MPKQKNKILTSFLVSFKILVFAVTLLWPKTAYQSSMGSREIFDLANQERISYQLDPLTYSTNLEKSAQMKAEDMLGKQYFSHDSPTGVSPWYWYEKAGYDYQYAGENLAVDFDSATKLNQAWMDSPTHRANILHSKFKEMGVGITKGKFKGYYTTIIVSHFGTKSVPLVAGLTNKDTVVKRLKFWENPLSGPLDLLYILLGLFFLLGILIALYKRAVKKQKEQGLVIKYKTGMFVLVLFLIVLF